MKPPLAFVCFALALTARPVWSAEPTWVYSDAQGLRIEAELALDGKGFAQSQAMIRAHCARCFRNWPGEEDARLNTKAAKQPYRPLEGWSFLGLKIYGSGAWPADSTEVVTLRLRGGATLVGRCDVGVATPRARSSMEQPCEDMARQLGYQFLDSRGTQFAVAFRGEYRPRDIESISVRIGKAERILSQ